MTAAEAVATIRSLAAGGRYFIVPHAMIRAEERGVGIRDIRYALETARSATWQADHETWKVKSADLEGDDLTLAVAIEGSVIVVTVF